MELLERFRPRFYLGPDQAAPIDFYRDYIAHGSLVDSSGRLIAQGVDQAVLNRHKHDPSVVFLQRDSGPRPPDPQSAPDLRSAPAPPRMPVVIARIDRDELRTASRSMACTFLTYTLVFRYSGLPAGLPWWKRTPLRLLGNPRRWHPLDHYTAATIVLDERERIVALRLQQHNYQTTYIAGLDFQVPSDQRVRIDIALDSNELYPHSPARTRHRAVSFLSQEGLAYLLDGTDPPLISGDDITDGQREVAYATEVLPLDDAFYVFAGWLGRRSRIPGRDAPPGADYNTLPRLKAQAISLAISYRWPETQDYLTQIQRLRFRLSASTSHLTPSDLAPFHDRLFQAFDQARTRFTAPIPPRRHSDTHVPE